MIEAEAAIQTVRLSLRLTADTDRDELIALERDAEVMRFITGGLPQPPEISEDQAGYLMPRGGEADVWATFEMATGTFVGWFSLRRCGAKTATLGYRLRRSVWRQGYGSEGASALINYGFRTLGLDLIVATTMAVNLGSCRVMENAGLAYVGTVHLDWPNPLPGSEQGEVEYEINREAWKRA